MKFLFLLFLILISSLLLAQGEVDIYSTPHNSNYIGTSMSLSSINRFPKLTMGFGLKYERVIKQNFRIEAGIERWRFQSNSRSGFSNQSGIVNTRDHGTVITTHIATQFRLIEMGKHSFWVSAGPSYSKGEIWDSNLDPEISTYSQGFRFYSKKEISDLGIHTSLYYNYEVSSSWRLGALLNSNMKKIREFGLALQLAYSF